MNTNDSWSNWPWEFLENIVLFWNILTIVLYFNDACYTTIFTLYLTWMKESFMMNKKKSLLEFIKKNSDSFVNPELYFKSTWGPWTTSTFWQRENNQEIAINILLYNKLIVISFRLAFMILKKNIVFKGPTHFFVCTLYSQTWL